MTQVNRSAFARAWPAVVARLVGLPSGRRRPAEVAAVEYAQRAAEAQTEPGQPSGVRSAPAPQQPPTSPNDHAIWLDERSFCLYVPTGPDSTEGQLAAWSDRLRTLGLASVVTTVGEPLGDSVDVLNAGWDAGSGPAVAEPYLEVVVGGEIGAFLYYRGDEMERELFALRETLGLRAPPRRTES
ncbi:hypothetical protein [Paraburkholderia tuberum]|uniref:Uncharacterized protein n=1 Tax=Paraburkholderia tuberum TaxID=157910 RepID=A0A1H1KL85_9BURK|nr:hypothetical protein [Paraburkholderia tuberum]SDR62509.1 hypothetical protein SAMN05445850_8231 [Paraburkholderia tuberum]